MSKLIVMINYNVFETHGFSQQIIQLTKSSSSLIRKKLNEYVYPQLRSNPYFGPNIQKLKDWNPPTWRYRIGDWRFFYQLSEPEKHVYMVAVYHRREAYR